MSVIVASHPDGDIAYVAKDFETAVDIFFKNHYFNPDEPILIGDQWTTLIEFFGDDVIDMMKHEWDLIDFNEFWNPDMYFTQVDYYE